MAKEHLDLVYGATNTLSAGGATQLVISLLDPERDKAEVQALLEGHPGELMARAGVYKLYGPDDATLESAEATGRGFVKEYDKVAEQEIPDRLPAELLGPTVRADSEALVSQQGSHFEPITGPITVELQAGEMQRMVLRVSPKVMSDEHAVLVRIDHYLDAERTRYIGGFAHVFLPS